jgi:hypothetical protein
MNLLLIACPNECVSDCPTMLVYAGGNKRDAAFALSY